MKKRLVKLLGLSVVVAVVVTIVRAPQADTRRIQAEKSRGNLR